LTCALSRDAITSCRPVRISRAEAIDWVGMTCGYQKGKAGPMAVRMVDWSIEEPAWSMPGPLVERIAAAIAPPGPARPS
jgi:hypothetical protein